MYYEFQLDGGATPPISTKKLYLNLFYMTTRESGLDSSSEGSKGNEQPKVIVRNFTAGNIEASASEIASPYSQAQIDSIEQAVVRLSIQTGELIGISVT